ncbi:MAG: DUF4091 domain-containing protein [Siphonobacter aquaeclarae]|nr:DUF4091 domain-containing protein [Siphonobacter aquaeclarae]
MKIWVSLDVPQTAVAGAYSGSIRVKNNGVVIKTFSLSVQVVDKNLAPASQWAFHLDIWQYPYQILLQYNQAHPTATIAAWSPQHLALLKPSYRLLAGAGQKAITTHIKDQALGGPSMIKWTKKANGTWEYDFTAFTNYVRFMQDSIGISTQINCFSLIGWNDHEIPYWDEASASAQVLIAPVGSVDYSTRWNAFLTSFKNYLDAQGWFGKTVLFMDEIADDKMGQVINLIKSNNSGWKIGVAHVKELSGSVVSQLYDKSGSLALASGHTNSVSTFYTSCSEIVPNNYLTVNNNPAEMTWMSWHSRKEGLDGYLRWGYDYWVDADPYEMRNRGNTAGDFAMIYRSSNELNAEIQSSIRFELLREGIQDFEKIRTLQTQLAASGTPYDLELLSMLNSKVNEFSKFSGTGAAALVMQGQKLLKDIVTGRASYCQAGGGANTSYYFSSVTSSGGATNLSYSRNTYPVTGYEHSTTSSLSARAGASVSLQIGTSAGSKCARMAVWVDWNNDLDFDDAGELVYSGGTAQSCVNSTTATATFTIPTGLKQGSRRIRMQLKDAWLAAPTTCGVADFTCTTDFDLNVLDGYCSPSTAYNSSDYYLSSFETTNACNGNVQYKKTYSPVGGYVAPSVSPLKVSQGTSFGVTLTNSASASCARTKVWADWNRDGDFSDAGEEVFFGGDSSTCNNLLSYRFALTVPGNASIGLTRLRVQVRDAWSAKPDACFKDGVTGTTDFDLEVASGLAACTPMLVSPVNGSRLASASPLFTWVANGTSPVSQWILSASWLQDGTNATVSKTLAGNVLSSTLDNLPTDGRPVSVTLNWGAQQATNNYMAADTYCSVRGGKYKGYFIQHLETSGGIANILYDRDKCPENGYERLAYPGVIAYQSATFNVSLQASAASYSAIAKVWIDWNGNNSFTDASELVFTGGSPQSAANSVLYSFPVIVPAGAATGSKRIRVQIYDAWSSAILCGIQNATATVDFTMNVLPAPQLVSAVSCTGATSVITGTVIGSTGSFDGVSTRDKVFDNDNNTYFDAPQANGQWVGLDLGSNRTITCLRFRPRNGRGDRVTGGRFQISADAAFTNPVTVYTIPSSPIPGFNDYYLTSSGSGGINTRYIRYLAPDNGWGNIAELKIYGPASSGREPITDTKGPVRPVLYPNPTTGLVWLSNWQEPIWSARIYSVSGVEWHIPAVGTGNSLNLTHLPAGSYVVQINEQFRFSIIKL